MKKAQYECTQYYEAMECDCGGLYINPAADGFMLLSNPSQRKFSCSGCCATAMLCEQDWPQVKVKIGPKITDA